MAEGHQAVAFSFAITHEGLDVNFDVEVLRLIARAGVRSWRKKATRFQVSSYCSQHAQQHRLKHLVSLVFFHRAQSRAVCSQALCVHYS